MSAIMIEKVSRTEGLNWWERFARRFRPTSNRTGPEYSSLVGDEEEGSISSDSDRQPEPEQPKKGWAWLKAVALLRYPLYISIIIHSLILVDLVWAHWFGRVTFGQYGAGFHTDFGMFQLISMISNTDFHRSS
jgi:hypothetical protein